MRGNRVAGRAAPVSSMWVLEFWKALGKCEQLSVDVPFQARYFHASLFFGPETVSSPVHFACWYYLHRHRSPVSYSLPWTHPSAINRLLKYPYGLQLQNHARSALTICVALSGDDSRKRAVWSHR